MSLTAEDVSSRFPIHWLVWDNNHEELQAALEAQRFTAEDLEQKDPRGRTPLLLAVTLGYIECVRVLLDAGADVNCEKDGWTAVQEATATGDIELLSLVLSRRDHVRHTVRAGGIPDLLNRLSLAPDFYVEMKWQFTSWVPLVSRMCPFDTYKVYKRGGNVRVDTTLVGFENNKWQRGDRTYIFRGHGDTACMVELDHESGTSWREALRCSGPAPAPPPRAIKQRLNQPLAINYLDTDKISFERNKSGIWGWRQDKCEQVGGYTCKVFSANNVELVSRTRTEHLAGARGRSALPARRAPLAPLLALADAHDDMHYLTPDSNPSKESSRSGSQENLTSPPEPPGAPQEPVTWQEYFSHLPLSGDRDIGRQKEITTKVQKFRATLWLCEDYPLELQEQIMPILDLMTAISSPHFAKLKDFIQMQLPAGFPVKIEIPLFHVLNARITFGNIFGQESPVPHVDCIAEGDRLACLIDDACFDIGSGYREVGSSERVECLDGEEGLLQYAIQQSLMEAGTHEDQVDVWEALRGARPASPSPPSALAPLAPLAASLEDTQLQRAIEESLASVSVSGAPGAGAGGAAGAEGAVQWAERVPRVDSDPELATALALSAQEHAARAQRLQAEQAAIDEAIRLSLLDK